jgi:hypothetical protein
MKQIIWIFLFCCVLTINSVSQAQSRRSVKQQDSFHHWTYDLGASTGSYNGNNYTELNLALNWNFSEYMTWRNSVFSRFGSNMDSVLGLDSSARLTLSSMGDSGLGIKFFIGPGYRFSNSDNSAVFGETGLTIQVAGLSVGAGMKGLYYSKPGKNADGTDKPKTDSNIFLILAGGGAF